MGNGIINWYLGDRLSERLVLDSTGTVTGRMAHLPFGGDFAESGMQEKHHFTTYEREGASGLDYALNRYYSPIVGRFNSADPYQASNELDDPRSWNRYSYTRNVVTNRVDPLGLTDWGAIANLIDTWLHTLPSQSINVQATYGAIELSTDWA